MVKIKLEDLVRDLQKFLFARRYVFYNIETREQIPDFLESKYLEEFHDMLRTVTASKFYEYRTFYAKSEFEAKLVKILFASFFMNFLEESNIDITTPELIVNNDVNIEHYEVVYKWLNIDRDDFRRRAAKIPLF